ncbi:uncharacterized protein LOC134652308 [Cydia amplana]|uniref:uncharacterized protein LOC134652308 n=1 Tax=Cydia amplana TaxID=1869771 RepID=UPI002FE58C89
MAKKELNVKFRDTTLKHNFYPKYLGVTLDRSLNFKQHLGKVSAKLKTRNSIIQKLTGTTWGANAATLRTSALSLVFSTAEYSSAVWLNSAHTSLVDAQLHHTMRLISGCLKPTPIYWLPVLSHILPPHMRRERCLGLEIQKIRASTNLPIHEDLHDFKKTRLKSRHPPVLRFHDPAPMCNLRDSWESEWESRSLPGDVSKLNTKTRPAGFEEPRRVWCMLNRIRTGVGNCAYLWHKWNWCESPVCPCGAAEQTVHHTVFDCPLTKYQGQVEDLTTLTIEAVQYLKTVNL